MAEMIVSRQISLPTFRCVLLLRLFVRFVTLRVWLSRLVFLFLIYGNARGFFRLARDRGRAVHRWRLLYPLRIAGLRRSASPNSQAMKIIHRGSVALSCRSMWYPSPRFCLMLEVLRRASEVSPSDTTDTVFSAWFITKPKPVHAKTKPDDSNDQTKPKNRYRGSEMLSPWQLPHSGSGGHPGHSLRVTLPM
jgi:hypothetical protein